MCSQNTDISLSVAVGKYRRQRCTQCLCNHTSIHPCTHTHSHRATHLLPLISPKLFLDGLYWQWDQFWQSTYMTKIQLTRTLQTQCPLFFSHLYPLCLLTLALLLLVSHISTLADSAVCPISFPQSVSFPVFISASHAALPQQLSQTADRQDMTMGKRESNLAIKSPSLFLRQQKVAKKKT